MLPTKVLLAWGWRAAKVLQLLLRRGHIGEGHLERVFAAVEDLPRPDEDPGTGRRLAELLDVKVRQNSKEQGLAPFGDRVNSASGCRRNLGAAPELAFAGIPGKLGRVNSLWSSPLMRSRYFLAVLAGLLLAASFPRVGIAGLAWIAPGLMLAAALGKRGWESFRIGYVAGLAYYLAALYWLLLIPYRWHSIPLGPAAGWLSLSAFVALYPATWVWFWRRSTATLWW